MRQWFQRTKSDALALSRIPHASPRNKKRKDGQGNALPLQKIRANAGIDFMMPAYPERRVASLACSGLSPVAPSGACRGAAPPRGFTPIENLQSQIDEITSGKQFQYVHDCPRNDTGANPDSRFPPNRKSRIRNPKSAIRNRKDSPSPARLRRATSPVKGEVKTQCRRGERKRINAGFPPARGG